MSVTTIEVLQISDSVARHINDLRNLVSGSQAALLAGQNTSAARIAALNDVQQIEALLDGFMISFSQETAFMTLLTSYPNILDLWGQAALTLEVATGGLQNYLVANNLQVVSAFADCFNRAKLKLGGITVQIADAQGTAARVPQYDGSNVVKSVATHAHLPIGP